MSKLLPYIITALLLCFAGGAAFGQSADIQKTVKYPVGTYTPKGDFGAYLEGVTIGLYLVPGRAPNNEGSGTLYNEVDLQVKVWADPVKKYKYNGKTYTDLCGTSFKGYSKVKIQVAIAGVGTKTITIADNDAIDFPLNRLYKDEELNQIKVTSFKLIEMLPKESERKDVAHCVGKQSEQAAKNDNASGSNGAGDKADDDKEDSDKKETKKQTTYIPKSNRQLYNELKAMTDAHPEMLNDPKIRTRLRGYKAFADRDDRNIRDYNTLEQTMGGGYNPSKITAMNSIYQTNANIANAEMAVDAGVDVATNVVNSIIEANNRKEEQELADLHRRTSANQDKVEAIKHREYQLLEQRRAYEKDIKSQIKADFNLIATIDDMPITYESENYIEKGLWDGHFEKASKTMDKTYNLYIVGLDGLYGISGDNGEALYPPQFEGIYALNLKNEDKRPRFLVNIKDKWGEILADGSIAEAIKYDGIWYAPDKKSKILKQGDSWQVKSLDKNSLLKQFTSTQLPGIYAGGLIAVINTNNKGFDQKSGNYSLADDGNVYVWGKSTEKGVASIIYESAKKGEVTERLFKINNKWFITSNFGTKDMKIEPMPATFVIPVLREKKWGAINQEGKTVIPFEHSYIKSSGNQFETDKETYKADGTLVSKKETEAELKNATKEYYDNGNIKTIGALDVNKKATGIWKFYRENGTLKSVANYKNGEAYLWEFYAEDGKSLEARIPTPEGIATLFHKSGRKKGTGLMIDGKEEERWQKYYDNEQSSILCEGEYLHGKQIALWKFYFENGKIMAEGRFIDGQEVGEWKYYHSNGNLKEVGKYNNGEKTGKWHQYDENGNEI